MDETLYEKYLKNAANYNDVKLLVRVSVAYLE